MEFKDRLREALKRRKRSVRSLWLELKEREVPGAAAYSSVHAYADGKTDPGVRWIAAAAEALNFRSEWLAFGTGEKTPEDAVAAAARDKPTGGDHPGEILLGKVEGIIGQVLAELGLAEPARSVVWYYCFYGPVGGLGGIDHTVSRQDEPGYEEYEAGYLRKIESLVRDFVESEFGSTLRMKEGDPQKFTAAVLAQASVVCLNYFPWGPWG